MLSEQQEEDTRRQLKESLDLAGVDIQTIADDLGTTAEYIERLFRLEPIRLEDTWILRNYLEDKVEKAGKEPVKFTSLRKNAYHIIWFLDAKYIDGRKITTV